MMQISDLVLERCRIVDLIGIGGEGALAKAVVEATGDLVAVKQLIASPSDAHYNERVARFRRAGELRIGHPVVVDPIEYAADGDEHYIILPYVEGVDLDVHVRVPGGKLAPDEARAIARELADGLAAIHASGHIHRDIKPANILIQPDGHPRIIDLGICRDMRHPTVLQRSGFIGTLEWMSPEQAANSVMVDHRTDLYSLGAVLYFMLTGSLPVRSGSVQDIIISICQETPPCSVQRDTKEVHYDLFEVWN